MNKMTPDKIGRIAKELRRRGEDVLASDLMEWYDSLRDSLIAIQERMVEVNIKHRSPARFPATTQGWKQAAEYIDEHGGPSTVLSVEQINEDGSRTPLACRSRTFLAGATGEGGGG